MYCLTEEKKLQISGITWSLVSRLTKPLFLTITLKNNTNPRKRKKIQIPKQIINCSKPPDNATNPQRRHKNTPKRRQKYFFTTIAMSNCRCKNFQTLQTPLR